MAIRTALLLLLLAPDPLCSSNLSAFFNLLGSQTLQELWEYALKLTQENPDVHIFMDEVAFETGAMTTEFMKQLDESVPEQNYLWVACKKNRTPSRRDVNMKSELKDRFTLFRLIVFGRRDLYFFGSLENKWTNLKLIKWLQLNIFFITSKKTD